MHLRRVRGKNKQQGGYVLLAILFALTLLVIAMAAAAPRTAIAGQRVKETELIRRGEQYALAIRRFYKKFGRYPSNVDQLENTNNIRFLRRRYLDPLTGKDDWTPIQFGQARPALGFFGQKIITTGGLSPSGPGLGPSTIGTGLGASTSAGPNGQTTGSSAVADTAISSAASSTTAAGPSSATGSPGTLSSAASGPSGSANNPITSNQLGGRTFGGGAIVGVSVPVQKESLKEFQQQKHYNEWQFVYDPTLDPTLRGGLGAGAATGVPGAMGGTGFPGQQNPGGLMNPSGFGQSTSSGQNSQTGTTSTNPTPTNPR